MSVTLFLVRHGQTEENVAHILQGQTPGKLTETGKEQARALCNLLQNITIDLLITSDLQRAIDTADIINEVYHLPTITEPLLRERNLGPYTGQPYGITVDESVASVESVEQMYQRASKWLNNTLEQYDGKSILVVSHGLFLRVMQGVFHGKTLREIKPMENTEMRTLTLSHLISNLPIFTAKATPTKGEN